MKTQTFGVDTNDMRFTQIKNFNNLHSHRNKTLPPLIQPIESPHLLHAAYKSYRNKRENGEAQDSPPGEFTYDGLAEWEQELDGYYHVKYTEGPSDKAWMEEKDRNYVFRLEREGRLDELEPNLRTEVPKLYEEVMAYKTTRTSETKAKVEAKENKSIPNYQFNTLNIKP